ncbi:MAG: cytochrome c3 family protein, partial [Nitrospirota bacterium]|nr:cytochrome c3 family protein [Nitrospirota bacterium]
LWQYIEPRGENRATELSPKLLYRNKPRDNRDYRLILWHDKNPGTLAFNPSVAAKTCGKCHAEIVKSFSESSMGGGRGAHTQSQYVWWTGPNGPQSCGLWLGRLSEPDHDAFTDENILSFNRHSAMPIRRDTAYNLQRNCNQCHVGCLDCHYRPKKKDGQDSSRGSHTFVKKPEPLACYGGGRAYSCHAGPLERRRGDGYLRGEFTQATPEGQTILNDAEDIHMRKGLLCTDCHEHNRESGSHGDLRRSADCSKCHEKIVRNHRQGLHKQVDCASCHTALIGGYAFNFWTAAGPEGKENPLTRIQDYYTDAVPPLLIKNPDGTWIPVHVVPHTSGNIKSGEVTISERLIFRNKPDSQIERRYLSNDSYAITGIAKNLDDKDHDTLIWLNLDRVAHATGKSRSCESCHASRAQTITVPFTGGSYKDVEVGGYTIVADGKGLRITGFKGSGGPPPKGLIPFLHKWDLKGDFALPGLKYRERYNKIKTLYEKGDFLH